jgi:hypothetical protein
MNRSALNPDIELEGPILHGEPPESPYADEEELDIIDDVSAADATGVDAAWTVDTGCGEVIAPAHAARTPE